jgi:oligosaccharide repeat unit polymerase
MNRFVSIRLRRLADVSVVIVAGSLIGIVTNAILNGNIVQVETVVAVLLVGVGSLGLIWQLLVRAPGRIDLFSPLVYFPVLYSLFYGAGSLVYARNTQITIPTSQYALYFAGLIAYFAGVLVALRLPLTIRLNPGSRTRWKPTRWRTAILGLFAVGMLSFAYVVWKTGLPVLSGDVENVRVQVVQQVGGSASYLRNSIEIAIILLFAYGFTRLKAISKDPRWVALLLFALLALASSGARRKVALPLMVAVILYSYLRKRVGLTSFLTLGLVVFLLLSLAGSSRHIGAFQIDQSRIIQIMYNETVRGADALYRIAEVFPSQFDFLGWRGALLPFAALAPGQQRLLGDILKQDVFNLGFSGGGWVPAMLGYFYVNFGAPGIYLGMLLVGFFIGAVYRRMLRNKDEFSTILYSYVAVYYVVALRSGFIEIWPLFVIGVFYLVDVYSRVKYRPKRVSSQCGGT